MIGTRLCNANQLELHAIINSKFPRRFSIANKTRTPRATREKFEADDERANLHDKPFGRFPRLLLRIRNVDVGDFAVTSPSLVTIHAAISFAFHGVNVTHR